MGIVKEIKKELLKALELIDKLDGRTEVLMQRIEKQEECISILNAELKKSNQKINEMQEKINVIFDNSFKIKNEVHSNHIGIGQIRDEVHSNYIAIKKTRDEVHENKIRAETSIRKLTKDVNDMKEMIQALNASLKISGVTDKPRKPRLIVSVTSYPTRIYIVSRALESIMSQTLKPDKIILWLAKDNFPGGINELPESIVNMQSRGLEIKWTEIDYKSYKKILPALQEYPNDIIVTVDDDLIYDRMMLELLYNSYKRHPDAISAIRAHRIAFGTDGKIEPYSEWIKEDSSFIDEKRMDLMATTGAGTLFPPQVLPEQTLDWEIIKEICPLADDIWMKMMSAINGVRTILVRKQQPLVYIDGSQEESLWSLNRIRNDEQLANILKTYSDIDLLNKLQE